MTPATPRPKLLLPPGVDPFVVAIVGAAALAWVAPARGAFAATLPTVTTLAIALLFFLHGAKLSREALLAGAAHPKLHGLVLVSTFGVFPGVGLLAVALAGGWLGPELARGVLLLAALPATVQSAIAFTSLARGNVAAAVCSASLSSLLGVFVTPVVLGALLEVAPLDALDGAGAAASRAPDGAAILARVGDLAVQLFVPFAAGHVARRWIGAWVERNRGTLKLVDQGSIVLVVYVAFGDAVRSGVLATVSGAALAAVLAVAVGMLSVMLAFTWFAAGAAGLARADRVTVVFAGSKKSLANGVPMATVLFGGSAGLVLLPLMLFHQVQLMACSALAQRWSRYPADDARDGATTQP